MPPESAALAHTNARTPTLPPKVDNVATTSPTLHPGAARNAPPVTCGDHLSLLSPDNGDFLSATRTGASLPAPHRKQNSGHCLPGAPEISKDAPMQTQRTATRLPPSHIPVEVQHKHMKP